MSIFLEGRREGRDAAHVVISRGYEWDPVRNPLPEFVFQKRANRLLSAASMIPPCSLTVSAFALQNVPR